MRPLHSRSCLRMRACSSNVAPAQCTEPATEQHVAIQRPLAVIVRRLLREMKSCTAQDAEIAYPVVFCLILPQLGCICVQRAGIVGLAQQALRHKPRIVSGNMLSGMSHKDIQSMPPALLVNCYTDAYSQPAYASRTTPSSPLAPQPVARPGSRHVDAAGASL